MSDCHDSCNCLGASASAHQTLDELDFERGIWSAAQNGDLERMDKLIARGTHPNQRDKSGYTALHYSSRNGHLDACKLLLDHGACVDAKTKAGGATALHRACTAGHSSIVDLLLSKGANLELQDADGKTALHRAAEKGNGEIYKLLQQYVRNPAIYDVMLARKALKGQLSCVFGVKKDINKPPLMYVPCQGLVTIYILLLWLFLVAATGVTGFVIEIIDFFQGYIQY